MNSKIIEISDSWLNKKPNQFVFSTIEGGHPGGSIKDHMVRGELEEGFRAGKFKKGDWICEISAGSTAVSLATYSKKFGLNCCLFLPDTAGGEVLEILRSLGAELHIVPMKTAYADYEIFLRKHPTHHPFNQMADSLKRKHYVHLGEQILKASGSMDYVVGAVGTGHSLLGVAEGLGERAKVVSAEPAEGLQISGVRNLNVTHFGEHDIDPESDFFRRIFVSKSEFFSKDQIKTNEGQIESSDSFLMVLAAVKRLLAERGPCRVLALAAKSKLVNESYKKLSA